MDYIKNLAKTYKEEYKEIFNCIKKYKKIAIFRHIVPDFDALGTQFGLATFIKDNFHDKDVVILGDNHSTFTNRLFPETDKINDSWFDDDFLAIIVDVGDKKRIADPRFEKAKCKIKFDHHPETEKIFDIAITNTSMAAASELVCNFIFSLPSKYVLTKLAASYFYIALVGDSGRFQYGSTSTHTFEIAQKLLEKGINITDIYGKMYLKKVSDLEIMQYILNNYKVSPHGVAYYVLTNDDLIKLNMTSDRGKENVNLFSNIEGINIWCSITEDITEPCFRISIRSRDYTVNGVASMFKGGGHAQASGAQIKDLTELDSFIAALDNLVIQKEENK